MENFLAPFYIARLSFTIIIMVFFLFTEFFSLKFVDSNIYPTVSFLIRSPHVMSQNNFCLWLYADKTLLLSLSELFSILFILSYLLMIGFTYLNPYVSLTFLSSLIQRTFQAVISNYFSCTIFKNLSILFRIVLRVE